MVVTLDHHLGSMTDRAAARLHKDFAGLTLNLHAAARWEDDGHVLLDVSDASLPHGALVRCAVDTGDCELAVRFDGPHLVAS